MQLTWSFYSYSPIYETLLGIVEITLGLLVFFKQTTKLGVVLFLPVMTNLVLINLIYDIGALPAVYPLFAAGLILFFIHFKSYKAFFFEKQDATHAPGQAKRNITVQVITILIGCGLAATFVYHNKFKIMQDEKIKGAWQLQGQSNIKRIYFEKGSTCVIKDDRDSLSFCTYQTTAKQTITIADETNKLLGWKDLPDKINKDTITIISPDKKQVLVKMNQP